MAEIVRMPKLSDTMTEGVVAEWHKKVGDEVKAGDLLAEIETDKATMEYESFQEGVLLYKGVDKGEAGPVESILAILGEEGEDYKALLNDEEGAGDEKSDESDEEKSEKSEKSEDAKDSKDSGKEDADGDEGASEDVKRPAARAGDSADEAPKAEGETTHREGRLKASPLARKMASDKGIDIADVAGSGEGGRIVKRDIENYKPKAKAQAAAGVAGEESYREEPVSQMRKTIARRLAESKYSAPHFYLTIELDMENVMASRKAINKAIDPDRISINDFVIKAAAAALKKHPQVNASWMEDKIRFNEHIHIGVAVAVDEGLLVPVVRFADTKSMKAINAEVVELAEKARTKKLQPSEWEGNTFTISNLGMYGIEEFTAIINPPDSAILAIGTIVEKPVVKNGQIAIGHTMKVTMSCDHRIVDGATGSDYLRTFRRYMENPVMMLAE